MAQPNSKPKAPTLKQAKAACLQIHSLIVRTQGNFECEAKGIIPGPCDPVMHCAHIIPKRRNTHISTELSNGWCLCASHHRLVDLNPAQWHRLVYTQSIHNRVERLQQTQERLKVEETRSPMMRYRSRLPELVNVARARGVDLSPVPRHILKWVESQ